MRTLSEREISLIREALNGMDGEQIQDAMFNLALSRQEKISEEDFRILERLGWAKQKKFTELGGLIADPLREHGFWRERKGLLPSEESVPAVNRRRFREKIVVEIGSGGGCNLMSLQGYPKFLVGIEPMPLYCQFTSILAEINALQAPCVVEGFAERLPISDCSVDVVICYSSHQYMKIRTALREIARILKPGGEVIIVGNTLYHFMWESLRGVIDSFNFGFIKYNFVSILNTVFYQCFNKYAFYSSTHTTANPIYPSFKYMKKTLFKEGLLLDHGLTCGLSSGESVFVAKKKQ